MKPRSVESSQNDAEAVFMQLFLTAEGRANPYPLYHRLRETQPVHRTQLGLWLLSRYDDCWAALRDPRLGKDYAQQIEQRFGPDWRRHPSLTAGEHSMLNTTGPEHTRLRKLVAKSFTPRMIEKLEPVIERTVDQLLDPVADAGGGNLLDAVGFPLPVTIIGEMLGVPETDRPQFRGLVRDLVATIEMQPTAEQMTAADAAQLSIRAYFLELIARKRRQPDDALLSNLANAEVGGDRLSDDELVTLATLLFAAGFETTTNLFGNGLLGLLRQPEQLELLRRDPCLGASLARAEIGITFRTLLRRFDRIELRGDEPRFQDRLTLRGLTAIDVACRAASSPRARVGAAAASLAVESPAATATTEHAERGLRPQAGDADADLRWRAEPRERIESEPARHDSLPVHTGERLAATVGLLLRNRLFERCTQKELEQLAATA